jgi:hypothetical protein
MCYGFSRVQKEEEKEEEEGLKETMVWTSSIWIFGHQFFSCFYTPIHPTILLINYVTPIYSWVSVMWLLTSRFFLFSYLM